MMRSVAAVTIAMALLAGVAAAEEPRTLSLSATGSVAAVPDMARVSLSVEARAPTARDAMTSVAERARAVLAALDAAGVQPADRQTRAIGLNPIYTRDDRSGRMRSEGFEARQDIGVTIRKLDGLGPLIDALTAAGVTGFGGISFDVAGRPALVDTARQRAVAESRRVAALMADAAGARLGPVLQLSMGESFQPMRMAMPAPMAADAAMPIAEGSIDITATVSVTFALE